MPDDKAILNNAMIGHDIWVWCRMKKSNSKTDRELSINSDEFIWDGNNESESHQYLARPIIDILRSASAKTVLDLGCGNGALSFKVRSAGFDVVGCDSSKTGIDLATKKYASSAESMGSFRHR
jgi:2-polyprenyl-3-methyl-5-hydroxy-6-metoxy-1,4-benzoquinol methylase